MLSLAAMNVPPCLLLSSLVDLPNLLILQGLASCCVGITEPGSTVAAMRVDLICWGFAAEG